MRSKTKTTTNSRVEAINLITDQSNTCRGKRIPQPTLKRAEAKGKQSVLRERDREREREEEEEELIKKKQRLVENQ
jgi:hypothetical protein